jgi:hypothetical protein
MAMATSGDPWELSAPESLVLRDGPRADRTMALKLGLVELVARGSVRLVEVTAPGWLGRKRAEKVLVPGHRPMPERGALAPIAMAVLNTRQKHFDDGTFGRPIRAVARAMVTGKKTARSRYVRDAVLPALAGRRLYRREATRLLGLFPRTRWARTAEGERRQVELETLLDRVRQQLATGGFARREAAVLLAVAGPAALLLTDAYPELGAVSEEFRRPEPAADGGSTADSTTATHDDSAVPSDHQPLFDAPLSLSASGWSGDPGAFDIGSISFDGLDFSGFDGIDAAFDAITSGFDAIASAIDGDGGGDGGGD